MNAEQAAPHRQQLLQQRAALLKLLATQRGGNLTRAEAAAEQFGRETGEDSHAQRMSERELAFAIDDHESMELAAIDAALLRIEAGTYGECTDCGADIAAARLHASPEAARCIHCQEKFEKQHAHG